MIMIICLNTNNMFYLDVLRALAPAAAAAGRPAARRRHGRVPQEVVEGEGVALDDPEEVEGLREPDRLLGQRAAQRAVGEDVREELHHLLVGQRHRPVRRRGDDVEEALRAAPDDGGHARRERVD